MKAFYGFLKLMARSFPLAKGTIPFMLMFGLIGIFCVAVAGSDYYDWYFTGKLYFPAKYGHGVYTSYSDAPGLFVVATFKNLLVLVTGVVCVVAAYTAPASFRKKEQARLAAKEAQSSHPPWPRRPKTPN